MTAVGASKGTAPIRFGIIGGGMMGREHIANLMAMDDVVVTAVADPDETSVRRSRTATKNDELAVFPDAASLVAAKVCDAVVLATPNGQHHADLEVLWNTGLHLMVEKPLCTTVEDSHDAVRRAAAHDGIVWMGLEYRYMPAITQLLDRVRAGEAGTPRMVAIREHRFPFLTKIGNWNRFTRNTGGTLVEKTCHFFDLMNLTLGEWPTRVYASGGQDVNHLDESYDGEIPDVLDNAFVIVDYPSGARAMLDLCMFAEGSRWEQEVSVTGDAGKLEAFVPNFMEVARGREMELVVGSRGPEWPVSVHDVEGDERVRYRGGHHGASYLELLGFRDAIRNGTAPLVTVEEGLWSVAMGAAAHRSIEEGRPVELAEFGLGD